jgi:ATP-dependent DNA helicase RecQ
LTREHNQTDVFQAKPLVDSMAEAEGIIDGLHLSQATRRLWLGILHILFNAADDVRLNLERIGQRLISDRERLKQMEADSGLSAGQIILRALHEMVDARLIDRGIVFSAILRSKGKGNAMGTLESVSAVETRLLALMRAQAPDADDGTEVELSIRRIVQRLEEEGLTTSPLLVRRLVKTLAHDGKGLAGAQGSIELLHVDRDRYRLRFRRRWEAVAHTAGLRRNVAHTILQAITAKAERLAKNSRATAGSDLTVSFSTNELAEAIRSDVALVGKVKKMLPAIDRALLFLHEQRAITLQGGLAALRQAMTIRLADAAKGRRFTRGDFKPLELHYLERRFQVHVMLEYIQLAMRKLALALTLTLDYFSMRRAQFVEKYFPDRQDVLDKATCQELYRDIVESLGNPVQTAVVAAAADDNMLVLAGPGSGKTTVMVHRCAYLIHVERINPRDILVLCFNHSAAVALRKRLAALAGKAARGVTVATYHGAALRLTGRSIRDMMTRAGQEAVDFDRIIADAVGLLKGETDIPGMDADEIRDRLLTGYSHILVDEYQDIDAAQYELVSAIAGRSLGEDNGKLAILAVGNDDQNIYTFRGTNVGFIRRFQEDYNAKPTYLVDNYRSSKHIITAANRLIAANRDRMKTAHPIRIDRKRRAALNGGRWTQIDPLAKGRVQIVAAKNRFHQAVAVKAELDRLAGLDPDWRWDGCAVLARTRDALHPVRAVFEQAGRCACIWTRGSPCTGSGKSGGSSTCSTPWKSRTSAPRICATWRPRPPRDGRPRCGRRFWMTFYLTIKRIRVMHCSPRRGLLTASTRPSPGTIGTRFWAVASF